MLLINNLDIYTWYVVYIKLLLSGWKSNHEIYVMRTVQTQNWRQIHERIKRDVGVYRQRKMGFKGKTGVFQETHKPTLAWNSPVGHRKQQFVYTSDYELTGVWKGRNKSYFCDRGPWNFRANKFALKKTKQNYTILSLLVYNKTELDLQVNKESMFTN